MYSRSLPRIDNIYLLKNLIATYPVSIKRIIQIARRWSFSRSTIDFLKYFPSSEVFESGDEFLSRCEDIETVIKESRHEPAEVNYGP